MRARRGSSASGAVQVGGSTVLLLRGYPSSSFNYPAVVLIADHIGTSERRVFPPYHRFPGCCNAICSSHHGLGGALFQNGGALNATHLTICGRSTAPKVILADESLGWIVDILDAHARFAIGATATPPVHRYRRLAGNGVSDH